MFSSWSYEFSTPFHVFALEEVFAFACGALLQRTVRDRVLNFSDTPCYNCYCTRFLRHPRIQNNGYEEGSWEDVDKLQYPRGLFLNN